jgi:hypothetical protein
MNKAVRYRIRQMGMALLTASFVVSGNPAFAAEVNGIWSEDSTKTLTEALGGIKARGWVSTYYNFRTNNANQGTTITGRTFDVRDQSFTLELAELELEKVPEKGKAGFKMDLGFGETHDQIHAGVLAAHGASALGAGERHLQHATVGYIADIGNGLRMDAGKMVTHIGAETIAGIKNNNFSHGYLYSYAIPFQQTGVRMNYKVNDRITTELYVLNGWNTTVDNDKGKAVAPSVLWNFGPFSGWVNYMGGLESDLNNSPTTIDGHALTGPGGCGYGFDPDGAGSLSSCVAGNRSTMRHLVDASIWYSKDAFNAGLAFDYGMQSGIASAGSDPVLSPAVGGDGTRTVKWYGGALYARYKLNDTHEPALRLETYVDPNNFTLAQANRTDGVNSIATRINSLTLTWNWKAAANLLVRPEFRWDHSNRRSSLFTDAHGRPTSSLSTVGLNATAFF